MVFRSSHHDQSVTKLFVHGDDASASIFAAWSRSSMVEPTRPDGPNDHIPGQIRALGGPQATTRDSMLPETITRGG